MIKPNDKVPPMVDYVIKMMLLEGIKCYKNGEYFALIWIQDRLTRLGKRLGELGNRGK